MGEWRTLRQASALLAATSPAGGGTSSRSSLTATWEAPCTSHDYGPYRCHKERRRLGLVLIFELIVTMQVTGVYSL